MSCLVVIDCTHVGSATASFKDLVTVAHGNSTNQTANVLGRGSATASFKDLVTVAHVNSTNQTANVLGRGSATASFGLRNSCPGVRSSKQQNRVWVFL